MAQQRVTDVTLPPGVGVAAQDYSASGQAGGGSGSVFGDLGGPGQQQGGGVMSDINSIDITPVSPGGVFGDLGGSGQQGQTGGAVIPPAPSGTDPGGQGGRMR
jgi:hypothetical protein